MSEKDIQTSTSLNNDDSKEEKKAIGTSSKRSVVHEDTGAANQKEGSQTKRSKIQQMMRERAQHPIEVQLYKKFNQLVTDMRE